MRVYCDKCHAYVEIKNMSEITDEMDDYKELVIEENKKYFQGKCPECGERLYQAIISTGT